MKAIKFPLFTAIVMAIKGGADMVIISNGTRVNMRYIVSALRDEYCRNPVFRKRVDESVVRIIRLKLKWKLLKPVRGLPWRISLSPERILERGLLVNIDGPIRMKNTAFVTSNTSFIPELLKRGFTVIPISQLKDDPFRTYVLLFPSLKLIHLTESWRARMIYILSSPFSIPYGREYILTFQPDVPLHIILSHLPVETLGDASNFPEKTWPNTCICINKGGVR